MGRRFVRGIMKDRSAASPGGVTSSWRMSQARDKMDKCGLVRRASCFIVLAFVFVFSWFQVLFFFNFLTVPALRTTRMGIPFFGSSRQDALRSTSAEGFRIEVTSFNEHLWKPLKIFEDNDDPCAGRYVYMSQLPKELNEGMLDDCKRLSLWTDMCKFTTNLGMGPPLLDDSEGSFSDKGWYATNQFAVEVVFHNRMKKYDCLTNDSSKAAAVFVPYYAGLDVARYLWGYNTSVRDAGAEATIRWLKQQPEWNRMGGRDHFMVAGRITWDFRRKTDKQEDWGNKLFMIPEAKNMTSLVIEASPWHYNDFAIPYPTYFHPTCDWDVMAWQDRMRKVDRPWLFSFAGAPRQLRKSIRGQIMEQCRDSQHCKLLECDFGESKCHVPSVVMKLFEGSVFCLQPQGDSFTRRSIFDSMLAGCIPVFFHPDSAYSQFVWHFPRDYRKYSVFISEIDIRRNNLSIESVLLQIPSEQVARLREKVIRLIPGLLYADPRHHLETMRDAFDVAVAAVIDKNARLRARLLQGHKDEELPKLHKKEGEELDEVLGNEDAIRRWQAQVQEETSN